LGGLGYSVTTASDKKNKILRLLDMWGQIFKHRQQIDFLLIDTYSTANFWFAYTSAKLAKKLSIPYICILHGGNLPERLKKSPGISVQLFQNAHINIAPSPYLQTVFRQHGFQNVKYIPNSIDITDYKLKKREHIQPKLLWVRSFSEIYNPKLAVFIFEEVKKIYPDSELCMVGPEVNGNLEECKKLADKKNLTIKFTGRLEKEKWLKLSENYDIFINTTNFDNTPFSVIEAMALGLPVISTNAGGLPYLIEHNKDGVLVEKDKVNPFVHEIKKMIENPQKTKQIAENARAKVEMFDWEVVKTKWNSILN